MRLVGYVLIFLLLLMASAQCQQNAEDWLKKGDLLLHSGKYDEANEAFNRALELNQSNQSNVDAWIYKGIALFRIGNYNESVICYDKAIEIEPNSAKAWANKGMVIGAEGRYNESILLHRECRGSRIPQPSGWG